MGVCVLMFSLPRRRLALGSCIDSLTLPVRVQRRECQLVSVRRRVQPHAPLQAPCTTSLPSHSILSSRWAIASRSSASTSAVFPPSTTTHAMANAVEIAISTATGKKLTVPTGLFINNEFVRSVDSEERIV